MLRGQDIVVLGSVPWRSVSRVNCHHIAARLAAENRVLFVESPGLRTPHLLHGPDLAKVVRRLRDWLRGRFTGPRAIAPGLNVLSPLALPFPGRLSAGRWNAMLLGGACARAARRLRFSRPVLWSFLPTAVQWLGYLREAAVVYHCTDDYAGNPGVNARTMEREERRLVRAADLCLATSRPLAARLAAMGGHVVCVPNVAEVERFAAPPGPCPADLARLPRPRIGYVGNVAAYMVDLDLLATVAARRPDWSFVLVGPVGSGDPSTSLSALRARGNVHLLGPKPYEQIPACVHAFDVCLIPFQRNRVTDSALPLKTFEYLAAGKPVVSRPLPALTAEPLDDVLAYAGTAEEFVRAIEACLAGESEAKCALRRERARGYSWARRFPEISAHVADALARKGEQGNRR